MYLYSYLYWNIFKFTYLYLYLYLIIFRTSYLYLTLCIWPHPCILKSRRSRGRTPLRPSSFKEASATERQWAWPQTAMAQIYKPVSEGQCHFIHLSILFRFDKMEVRSFKFCWLLSIKKIKIKLKRCCSGHEVTVDEGWSRWTTIQLLGEAGGWSFWTEQIIYFTFVGNMVFISHSAWRKIIISLSQNACYLSRRLDPKVGLVLMWGLRRPVKWGFTNSSVVNVDEGHYIFIYSMPFRQ